MFESLGNRFSNAFASLRSRGKLSTSDVTTVCQEIRQALLDADVALTVVEEFVGRIEVEAKAALVDLQAGSNQAQAIFEIVNKALVELLGSQARRVAGLQHGGVLVRLLRLELGGMEQMRRRMCRKPHSETDHRPGPSWQRLGVPSHIRALSMPKRPVLDSEPYHCDVRRGARGRLDCTAQCQRTRNRIADDSGSIGSGSPARTAGCNRCCHCRLHRHHCSIM